MGATTVAVVSGAIMVASSVAEGMGNYGEQKRLEKINKYNAAVTAEKIKSLNYEEAMNETLRRLNAYSEIGSAKNYMGSRGNVGTSADSAIVNAYMNLAGDLEAMSFNYENRRIDLTTEKNNYLYQAGIAKAQKKAAVMSGILGVGGSLMKAYTGYKRAGGEYWDISAYEDESGNTQSNNGYFSSVFGRGSTSDTGRARDLYGNVVK